MKQIRSSVIIPGGGFGFVARVGGSRVSERSLGGMNFFIWELQVLRWVARGGAE